MYAILYKKPIFVYNSKHYGEQEIGIDAFRSKNS
jgi:hypothetical protein